MSEQLDRIEVKLMRLEAFLDALVDEFERRQGNGAYEMFRAIIVAWTHARRTR